MHEKKWKGKCFIISKDNENKIIKKIIFTKLFIIRINDFSYKIIIKNLICEEYSNIELLGFVNKVRFFVTIYYNKK